MTHQQRNNSIDTCLKNRAFFLILVPVLYLVHTSIACAGSSFENSIGMEFVKIRAGSFVMGSPASEPGRKWDEKQHRVTITRGFYIAATEVTQDQWSRIMKSNPSVSQECGGSCPVETVSWYDCLEFVEKLNSHEKTNKYRLPTEAEWEYSCRAGTKTAFANGDITKSQCELDPVLDKIGWYCGNTGTRKPVVYGLSPKPVAQKKPNAWGLYDMHGNVQEWCFDACKPRGWLRTGVVTDTYRKKKIVNPVSRKGPNRIIRGGSWNTSTKYARSANRGSYKPTVKRNFLGFRVVKDL